MAFQRVVLVLSLMLTLGVGSVLSLPVNAAGDADRSVYRVAFAQDTLSNDFRRAQVLEVQHALAPYDDIAFVYSDAQGKTSLLIHQIRQFIYQQVDVLIVGTNDAQLVVPVIEQAHEQGIKVLILDRGVATERYTSFLNSDNVLIGRLGARFIAERLNGKGQVLLMEGLQTADVTRDRTRGFLDVIGQYPDISVIRRTGNYLRKDALLEMEKMVAEKISVDAIFSESDSMLSGVRAVLARHKIDPASIISVGCDYTSEAREAILAGSQTGSVLFPLGGKATAQAVLALKAGRTIPHHINIPADLLVTRDNVNQVKPVF
ncbi:MAG: substrate-binding domain-containing protein [Oceanospirillum sp.]|nr:substrate-binding domain-containing protein [Oceanospirillum sp.]